MIIFTIALLANAFSVTSLSVQDTNATTYVVVPMLMLPIFAFFTMKSDVWPNVGKRDIIAGAMIGAAYLFDVVAVWYASSFEFVGLRLDLLLLPIGLTAIVTLLFGLENLGKFKAFLLYSVVASPVVLTPIIGLAQGFTVLNTVIVYDIIHVFVPAATYLAPISIIANGYSIGIGQTCVSIGAFIALVLFLIPVAYVYEGRQDKKAWWVASGVVLLLAFNLLRMFFITAYWLSYGPSQVVSVIHTFVGSILFYIAVIVMLLIAGRYQLGFRPSAVRPKPQASSAWGVAIAAVIAIAYLLLSSNYQSALVLPQSALQSVVPYNFSNPAMARYVDTLANIPGYTTETLSNANSPVSATILYNSTIGVNQSILAYVTKPNDTLTTYLLGNSTILGRRTFLSDRGTVESVVDLNSKGSEFFLFQTVVPYALSNGSSTDIGVYILMPGGIVGERPACSSYDKLYTYLFSLPDVGQHARLDSAYCIADRIAWYNET